MCNARERWFSWQSLAREESRRSPQVCLEDVACILCQCRSSCSLYSLKVYFASSTSIVVRGGRQASLSNERTRPFPLGLLTQLSTLCNVVRSGDAHHFAQQRQRRRRRLRQRLAPLNRRESSHLDTTNMLFILSVLAFFSLLILGELHRAHVAVSPIANGYSLMFMS